MLSGIAALANSFPRANPKRTMLTLLFLELIRPLNHCLHASRKVQTI
jgi:hypothetical protein